MVSNNTADRADRAGPNEAGKTAGADKSAKVSGNAEANGNTGATNEAARAGAGAKTSTAKPSPKSGARCPMCRKLTVRQFRPFCSRRCADLDLSRWLNGHYAIPVVEEDGGLPDSNNFED